MTRGRMRSWAIRRQPRSTIRCRGPRQHECSSRPGVGCRCARPPPGSPLRPDPAARGACGDLAPVSAHRRKAVTGRRPRPATLVAGHDYDENRPSRLHLSNARSWSEEWGPPPHVGEVYQAIDTKLNSPTSTWRLLRRPSLQAEHHGGWSPCCSSPRDTRTRRADPGSFS